MRDAIAVFCIALAVYTVTAGGHLYSPDDEILFRTTASLVEDRDLAIEPLEGFATRGAADDKQYAQYGIGQPILAVPFYAAGRVLAAMGSDETWARIYGIGPDEPDGARGYPHTAREIAPRFACSFFNLFAAAALAAVLFLLMIELNVGRPAALLTIALYAFGSLAWPHSRPFFSETAAVLFVVIGWYCLLRGLRGRILLWAGLAGAAAGFAALIRLDSILLYPGLALVLLGPIRAAAQREKPSVHPYVVFCAPAALIGIWILALNWIHFGHPFSSGYSDQPEGISFSTPLSAGLYGFLFSAGKGLFFFSPALVLSLWAWKPLVARDRMLAAGVALSIAIPLLVMAKWQNWSGGWSWGPRHIFMIHPFLAIPIGLWLAEGWAWPRRAAAIATLVAGIGVQLLGSSQDFITFHRVFFRNHSHDNFRVGYDNFDMQYWDQYFRVAAIPPGQDDWIQVPLLAIPAPIQQSLYDPRTSVWNGYPRMWADYGLVDNVWIRILRGR